MNEEREQLKKLCEEALKMRGFQPGAYGKGKTHCNRATEWICRNAGYNTNWMRYMKSDGTRGYPGTANYMYLAALKAESRGDIIRLTKEEAHHTAWKGIPVIVTTRSMAKGRSGHIAVVYPTDPKTEPLKIANVGGYNLICEPEDRKAFGDGFGYLSEKVYFQMKK